MHRLKQFGARIRRVALWTTLFLTLSLLGCASQPVEPSFVYKTKTLYKDRYQPVDSRLTDPVTVEYAPDERTDTIDLKTTLQACQVRTKQCNGQLAEIADKAGDLVTAPETQQ